MKRIVDIKKYRNDIISLWYECFGDEAEYIEFFLNRCPNKLCLGCFENNRLVSMLFLLNGEVDGFPAKYIYAACTAHEFRSRGFMAELIDCSKHYCVENGILFFLFRRRRAFTAIIRDSALYPKCTEPKLL